jgi:hypothetical protein
MASASAQRAHMEPIVGQAARGQTIGGRGRAGPSERVITANPASSSMIKSTFGAPSGGLQGRLVSRPEDLLRCGVLSSASDEANGRLPAERWDVPPANRGMGQATPLGDARTPAVSRRDRDAWVMRLAAAEGWET